MLANKKYITELGLSNNGIFAEGAVALGQSLKDKKYLEVFNLKKNEMGLAGIKALEECLTNSKTLKELNLSGNNIGDEGLSLVVRALKARACKNLTKFCVSSNNITSAGCKATCDFIQACSMLEELQLANNDIDNVGAAYLIKVLKDKTRLSEIDICLLYTSPSPRD